MPNAKSQKWITLALILGIMLLSLGLFLHRLLSGSGLTPEQLQAWGAYLYPEPRELQPFQLLDDQGRSFGPERLRRKWTLAFLGFTRCPDVCPTAMATLRQFKSLIADQALAADTQVLMISLDPEFDTPERLGQYVRQFDPSFIGVTGPLAELQPLARQLHVVYELGADHGTERAELMHSDQILLFDPEGRLAGFFKAPHNAGNLWQAYKALRTRRG